MIAHFWDTEACSLTEVDRRFRGAHCLHCQGDEEAAMKNRLAISEQIRQGRTLTGTKGGEKIYVSTYMAVAYFKIRSRHSTGWTDERHKKIKSGNRAPLWTC
jgi:hypothetical protein